MQQVVYVDVLFALNLIIGFFLISAVKRLLRESACACRVLGGAALGGVYSLAIFLPELPAYISFPVRTAFLALVALAVFGFGSARRFLRCWAALAGVTFLFSGVVAGVWFLLRPASLALKNGAVYFDIGFLPLTLCAAACYALLRLFGRFLSRRNSENARCSVTLEHLGKSVSTLGIIDTGNTLADSFTGKKVNVISVQAALALLPAEYIGLLLDPLSGEMPGGVHLIPASTIKGDGLMPALTVKRMTFIFENKTYEVKDAAIAVSSSESFADGCSVLLNADILFGAKTERYGGRVNDKKTERKAENAPAAPDEAKQRRALHKRSGNAACTAERGTGAGDNETDIVGR